MCRTSSACQDGLCGSPASLLHPCSAGLCTTSLETAAAEDPPATGSSRFQMCPCPPCRCAALMAWARPSCYATTLRQGSSQVCYHRGSNSPGSTSNEVPGTG